MKGKWLFDLCKNIFQGSVNIQDGIRFFLARFVKKPTSISINGVSFLQADHVLWSLVSEIFISKEYTPRGFEILENDVVVDVGAHKGVFTAYAAKSTRGPIIAVEPAQENIEYLEKLVHTNGWENVRVLRAAVTGLEEGKVKLYLARSSSRNSILGKDVVSDENLQDFVEVENISLENVIGDLENVDLLKLDCEGAEFAIIKNTNQSIFSKIQKMVLEYHAKPQDESLSELISKLDSIFQTVTVIHKPNTSLGYIYVKK